MWDSMTSRALSCVFAALVDTNLHWNQSAQDKITHYLWSHIGHSRVVCAPNVPKRPEDGYKSGGSMMLVIGSQRERMQRSGSTIGVILCGLSYYYYEVGMKASLSYWLTELIRSM